MRKIWHAGMVVTNLESAIEFYTKGLGLNLIDTPVVTGAGISSLVGYEGSHLKEAFLGTADQTTVMDSPTLALIEYVHPRSSEKVTPERNAIGAGHVGFFVDGLDELFARLVDMGAGTLGPPTDINDTTRGCYLTDPDGNWIELVEMT